jgi:NAD(P)H-dependent FMN reductase
MVFETLHLGDADLRACRGCRACFDRGADHCPLQDDVAAIRARMDAADGLIVATPVYVNDVSGLIKTWLDRLAYLCHRPALAGTCAYLVATVASSPTNHALRTLDIGLRTWGLHIAGRAGFAMGALMPPAEALDRFDAQAARAARSLYQAIAERRALRPSFLSLMMFRIQQLAWRQEPEDTLDYAYWHGQGWLDSRTTYYIAHQAPWPKVALARLVGNLVARLVA